MKKKFIFNLILSLFFNLFVGTLAYAIDLVPDEVIPIEDQKTFKNSTGDTIQVTHKVPDTFYGTYDLKASQINFPEWARRWVFRPDGTGEIHKYGSNEPVMKYNWGLLVFENKIARKKYYRYATAPISADNPEYPSVEVFMMYEDGSISFSHFYLYNDKLVLIGPYSSRVYKDE
jgi:hypothetical protein